MKNRFLFWMEFLFSLSIYSLSESFFYTRYSPPFCAFFILDKITNRGTRFYSTSSKKSRSQSSSTDWQRDLSARSKLSHRFCRWRGCFHVAVRKNENLKLGWEVMPGFTIVLHNKDKPLLVGIQKSLQVYGKIYRQGPDKLQLQVHSIKELESVIIHFEKFELLTQKRYDFRFSKRVLKKMKLKEHLTLDGLHEIVVIKASMNRGLSEMLKVAFPDIVPVERPKIDSPLTRNPNWLAGFASAEGCFLVQVIPCKTHSLGYEVKLVFQLTQHSRDENLLITIQQYLDCGNVYKNRNVYDFRVTKYGDITDKIIPLKKFRIRGVKEQDFLYFSRAAEMINNKEHLTPTP